MLPKQKPATPSLISKVRFAFCSASALLPARLMDGGYPTEAIISTT